MYILSKNFYIYSLIIIIIIIITIAMLFSFQTRKKGKSIFFDLLYCIRYGMTISIAFFSNCKYDFQQTHPNFFCSRFCFICSNFILPSLDSLEALHLSWFFFPGFLILSKLD